MIPTYETAQLPCGLRIIAERRKSPVVYCGFVVCAGTRHEEAADAGMAHFIEHMSFKGTAKRHACHITNGLERVGGDLNAYTTKQETVYYATVLRRHFSRAADLLADLVFHSTYPQREIDKEVEVICDEIDSYKDSPSEIIFDQFESLMYPGQPLGRDILGQPERLRAYTTADALRFTRRFYHPANVVFYCYGNVPMPQIVRTLERLLPASDFDDRSFLPPACPTPQPHAAVQTLRVDKGTHQAHVLVGAPTFGGTDPRRHAMLLLNNMLGGPGMNSRLNLSLREKAGLVYSVDAYLNTYPDTGFWNVYFGCDLHDVERCLQLLRKELHRFIECELTPMRLRAAQKQLLGQIGISTDSSESYALAMGKTFAHYGKYRDVYKLDLAIRQITASQVREVAEEVYDASRLTTLIYE